MKVIETEVKDVFILEPQVFGDNRGWFMESWSEQKMEEEVCIITLYRIIILFQRRKEPCGDCIFKKVILHRQNWFAVQKVQ